MKHKHLLLLLLVMLGCLFLSSACQGTSSAEPIPGAVEVSFDFSNLGMGSGQYAFWIEDAKGNLVKTVFVTRFIPSGGYKTRRTAIPTWQSKVALPDSTIDAISGSTPATSSITYAWDGTNNNGVMLPQGEYKFYLEVTLSMTLTNLYSGTVTCGTATQEALAYETTLIGTPNTALTVAEKVVFNYIVR